MATDAAIYFRIRDGQTLEAYAPPRGASIEAATAYCPVPGATHTVWQAWRYFGPEHLNGEWPRIAAVLMALLANPAVESVWYGGDHEADLQPFTAGDVLKYSAAYMGVDTPLWDNGPACRVCGCTEDHACPGGCWWIEEDLCSQCGNHVAEGA